VEIEIRVGSLARGFEEALRVRQLTTLRNSCHHGGLDRISRSPLPTIFTALTSLIPVLDAAAKYDMNGFIERLSAQLMEGVMGDALMYQDPLWVYTKANQLDLADLANAAANATPTIDLDEVPCRPDAIPPMRRVLTKSLKPDQWSLSLRPRAGAT